MSRSAAARADHHDRARPAHRSRAHGPALPRRVSGPVRPPRAPALSQAALAPSPAARPRTPARPPLRLATGGASIALRVAEAAMEVSGSRTMDRLVRSRGWVAIVAFGLIGIVAMQVSLLKLNAGIGRAVETAATLERTNATLRGEVSRLSSGDRILALAGARGFVMPEPGDVTYLRAGDASAEGARAAKRMRAPDPLAAGPAGSVAATAPPPVLAGPGDPAAEATAPAAPVASATAPAATPGATAPAAAAPVAPPAAPDGTTQAAPAASAAPATASGGVTVP